MEKEWEWISSTQRTRLLELMHEIITGKPPARVKRDVRLKDGPKKVRCDRCARVWTQTRRCSRCGQLVYCCSHHLTTVHDCS